MSIWRRSRSTSRGPRRRSRAGPACRDCATASFRVLGKRNPTTRDFMEISHRGTFRDHPRFVGSPKDVADGMEEWFSTRACDGYVVAASHVPGGYEEFVRYVVPELQRRGLLHNDYRGTTLRENLGLERPRDRRVARGSPLTGGRSHEADVFAGRLLDRHPCAAGRNRQAVRGATGEPARRRAVQAGVHRRSIRNRRCRRWCATTARC